MNGIQSMGSFAGTMIGSGFLLLAFNKMGWSSLLPFLALFVLIALIPLAFFKDKDNTLVQHKEMPKFSEKDLVGFFQQKGIWKQVVFLFLYYLGIIGTLSMLKPMLVDYGYTIQQIGVMMGIVGTSVACITSLGGGFLVRRMSRYASRVTFAIPVLISAIYFFALVNYLPVNATTLYLGIALLWGSYGFATVVVYTTSMDCVRKGFEGTDFTLQTVITHLSGMIMAAIAGGFAESHGYSTLFMAEMALATISLLFVIFAFRKS